MQTQRADEFNTNYVRVRGQLEEKTKQASMARLDRIEAESELADLKATLAQLSKEG